jgi:putative DNA primase/helicase
MSHVDVPEPEPEYGADWDVGEQPAAVAGGVDYAPLGHDKGRFYFFSFGGGQVREMSGRDLFSVSSLCELAPLRYWEMNFPGKGEAGFNVRSAGDALTRACYSVGIYDPARVRGLGAWLDDGRTVLHVGDRCIVDGAESSIVLPGSRHIYENAPRLRVDLGEQLSSLEANRLRELCSAAPWERPDHMGQLLAGWCVIAPVCGAMPWRPHLWITSEAGGGKSWVLDNIIKPTVGALALSVQSKTTEAALRQALGCDARPIIFDEIETQNERDRERVQHVLDLARQASSEDGAAILKGSSGGKVTRFCIRSCFAFASINVGVSQAADESRTVVLTLKPDEDMRKRADAFERLRMLHAQTMIPGFSGRLLARTLSLLPVIRANAVLFAEAIARSGKPRRLGDTYGVLMAGAWSLRSRAVVTADEADAMVAGTQWVREAVAKADVEPEWSSALSTLMQYRVRVLGLGGRPEDVPVGDLINASLGRMDEGAINPSDARVALHRMGMRVHEGDLQIANNSQGCSQVFMRTPWATSWRSTLCRMPGASKNVGCARLAGHVSKIFSLPLASVAVC